ncbi:hypothetical protein IMSAGC020_00329 [Lachnospiraceae bacterium]|nr:hypothetical protein IMSAGC020_00329 [Lachnospiraceae bacterium]
MDVHLPHYIWGDNINSKEDLKELLTEYIEKYNENKMLLILGQPGIGKSTLITWITANFNERVDDILVFQFVSDLKNVDWKRDNISESILKEIGLSHGDLNGKVLILDGYDEISIREDERKEILDKLYWNLIKNRYINNFSLIIMCRENYIKNFKRLQCKYITLQSWNVEQIKSFCATFQGRTNKTVLENTVLNLLNNKEILGIPLITYMVLALDIPIEKEGFIVDVYDKIFSLEGGIYDRCIDYKSFAEKHRVGKIKNQIHQISREIAIWMFENKLNEAYIPVEEYKKICVNILQENEGQENDIEQDFILGIFLELKHCEGGEGEKLYFVHRSIYEYFVVETIYNAIENPMIELSDVSQEELAKNIVVSLKKGDITRTIGQYLQYKIGGIYNQLSPEKKERFYDWWELAVAKTLDNMDYRTECKCFMNILKILRLLLYWSKRKYIMENIDRKVLERREAGRKERNQAGS